MLRKYTSAVVDVMIIKVENLTKTYKSYERGNTFREAVYSLFVRKTKYVEALKGISFTMEKGELVGFLGPNGAGKSTTLKILTGILFPTGGKVDIMVILPGRTEKICGHIGAVFGQNHSFCGHTTIDAFYLNKAIYSIPINL